VCPDDAGQCWQFHAQPRLFPLCSAHSHIPV